MVALFNCRHGLDLYRVFYKSCWIFSCDVPDFKTGPNIILDNVKYDTIAKPFQKHGIVAFCPLILQFAISNFHGSK